MAEEKKKAGFDHSGSDCSARPVWIREELYDLIRKIRNERGGNISSVVEDLIGKGIRCHDFNEPSKMHCSVCILLKHDKRGK